MNQQADGIPCLPDLTQVASVAGERLEQVAAQVRYQELEPYIDQVFVEDEWVEVERVRRVDRYVDLSESTIQVQIEEILGGVERSTLYQVEFEAKFTIANPLDRSETFFFDMSPG